MFGHLYRVTPARWAKLPTDARLAVWVKVPNPEMSPQSIAGDFLGWEPGEHGPTMRLRTVGRMVTLVPRDDIDSIMRRAAD